MLLCFVVPRSRNIWMSSYYLRLVEDDPQLAYVLGHELSHVICQHGKDFCFLEFVREALLVTTGYLYRTLLINVYLPLEEGLRIGLNIWLSQIFRVQKKLYHLSDCLVIIILAWWFWLAFNKMLCNL